MIGSAHWSVAWPNNDGTQVPPPPLAPVPARDASLSTRPKKAESERPTPAPRAETDAGERRVPAAPHAVARVSGVAAPGLRVTLHGEESLGDGLSYRWIQTFGPPVLLDDAKSRTASFTAPAGVGRLGFLLVATGPRGADTADVSIPLEGHAPSASASSAPTIRADAGDDQIGLINRQITLNGVRSEPATELAYRWIQVGGPTIRSKIEDRYMFSFLPAAPGVYKFALVVASGSQISEPDYVSVTVGSGREMGDDPSATGTSVVMPTQELARSSLVANSVPPRVAEELAIIFEASAERIDVHGSYLDTFSDVSGRLEDVLVRDPARRQVLVDRVFTPLSMRLLDVMKSEGLDLRQPEAQNAPLASYQKAALAEQFRLIAEGFRSVRSAPR